MAKELNERIREYIPTDLAVVSADTTTLVSKYLAELHAHPTYDDQTRALQRVIELANANITP